MMKVCRNCYTENPLDAVLCSECGMSLTRAPTGEEAIKLREEFEAQSLRREEAEVQLELPPMRETPSGQSRLAYRLAAALLFVNVFLNILDGLVAGGSTLASKIIPIVGGLVLAIGLLQLRGGFRLWALVAAVLGAIAFPILSFLSSDALTAIWMSVIQWGLSGALILLLTGQSKTWRLALAVGIYVVFTLVPFGLLLLLIALAWLLGVEV